ncbi:MAG: hypothetical protein ACOX6Z_05325 [Dethiobacteria bacterium]|jgi:hypothetical protein
MKHFLDAIRLILLSIGIDFLESKRVQLGQSAPKEATIYEFNVKDAKAKMKIKDNKYISKQLYINRAA